MFSYIDPLLFPDEIDVLEISENRHILPIFKNGSSSLYRMNFKKVQNFQDLKEVEVLVRDPYERFVSGVKKSARRRQSIEHFSSGSGFDQKSQKQKTRRLNIKTR